MKKDAGVAQVLAMGLAIILIIMALPLIWLYDQVGGSLFLIIVCGIPAVIFGVTDEKKRKAAVKQLAQQEQDEKLRQVLQQRRASQINDISRSRVHEVDRDGELAVDWRRQFEEIVCAWRKGDYDFARTWLQKLAYRLKSENAPQWVHTRFKAMMAEFTRDDPLYADVMRVAIPAIAEKPGIVQSNLAKQFPRFDAEQFRYAMYYGEVIGDVVREKKGRSYTLSLPKPAPNNESQPPRGEAAGL